MEKPCADVIDNLHRIEDTLCTACAQAGRRRDEGRLRAVTKTVEPARIQAALDAGVDLIGENRVQEWLEKRPALRLEGVQAHLIGHLQTNKVNRVVGTVEMIQSVDSFRLAQAIDKASQRLGRVTDVLVEVNVGNEPSKTGVASSQAEELVRQIAPLAGLRVCGLMTIPPIAASETEKRTFFSQMRKLFIDIRGKTIDNVSMDVLSMGMSSDFREAVLEGATLVRIGSALFGRRS